MNQQAILHAVAALEAGDKHQARRILEPLLSQPTSEICHLVARASEIPAEEIKWLERAVALDPFNARAKTRLFELRAAHNPPPQPATASPTPPAESPLKRLASKQSPASVPIPAAPDPSKAAPTPPPPKVAAPPPELDIEKLKRGRRGARSAWTTIGCLGMILLSLSSSFFVIQAFGLALPTLPGAGDEVQLIEGTPIAQRPDAVYHVEADVVQPLDTGSGSTAALTPGSAHEYTFSVRARQEFALAIQFFSPNASRVRRNVALIGPDGRSAESHCERTHILDANSGVAYTCVAHKGGEWKVRILGRAGESTGAYVVTMQPLS